MSAHLLIISSTTVSLRGGYFLRFPTNRHQNILVGIHGRCYPKPSKSDFGVDHCYGQSISVRAEVSKHERGCRPFDTSGRTEMGMLLAETVINVAISYYLTYRFMAA
jgi:hypothetical protein